MQGTSQHFLYHFMENNLKKKVASTIKKKNSKYVKKNFLPKLLDSKLQTCCHIIPNKNIILQTNTTVKS